MNNTKPWYTSKTIWGSLVAVTAAMASVFGLEIESQTQIVLTEAILQGVTIVASLFAVFGRLGAKSIIE